VTAGVSVEVVVFDVAEPTAQEAARPDCMARLQARSLGVQTSQIVHSAVYELKARGKNGVRKPILVCAPGA
jgi:hypothetical protein